MATEYNEGDLAVVTGTTVNEVSAWHYFKVGDTCRIKQVGKNGYYLAETDDGFTGLIHSQDLKPVAEQPARCPTTSEGYEG